MRKVQISRCLMRCSLRWVTLAGWLLLTSCSVLQPETQRRPVSVGRAGRWERMIIRDPRIIESSGIALSRWNDAVLWTHNDSGDIPRLFAMDTAGHLLAEYRVAGAQAVDWEDISAARSDRRGLLLIADTGDNRRERSEYQLYLVEEPQIPAGGIHTGRIEVLRCIRFVYPDGPHNCEAVALDPPENPRRVLLATKERRGCAVYLIDLAEKGAPVVARRIIGLQAISRVTGMDISADGSRLILLTYGDAYEFRRRSGESWRQALSRHPGLVRLPRRRQGEAICYGRDRHVLYLTSEGSPLVVWCVRRGLDR